ncbi:cell envelope-related protein transcriptional attenuator [Beutenbergia cavernae DSM 12333]|uniref:Cell envelope-related protein transcriptional attenuator n=1 Tax=Beutenbergia cavernae (strain ATCC BAA-8 / DSM 12333 / CCUG 43141 / JCM 11478 / NBRC 16432 / NCIMB 13614 / HKI 0122) TaxID=471853 RepID=C5C123_BEUC1|nr:LCP family protein [Beutenbergia cavernae]ACQ79427.1 cell envelope-related protein transcriptional attenuator [Beutenbergia cavernae DSM 12333]
MPTTSDAAVRRGPRHSSRMRSHRFLRGLAVAVIGVLAFSGTGAYAVYDALQNNINNGYDLDDILGAHEPTDGPSTPSDPKAGEAYNILVLGSDSRGGDNAGIGGEFEGMRSDTTLFVHISADRSRVEVVSIPRDLLVDVPACPLPDGSETYPQDAGTDDDGTRFNSAFSLGAQTGDIGFGAACAVLTVQEMTGMRVDDFVVVDFTGFQSMVDSIGGVPMCIPEPMQDPKSDLDLQAGDQTLNGQQALALARARHNVAGSDGSDIGRIDRQQELLAAMVRQVLSKNIITDSGALFSFLNAATASLTTSEGIGSITTMAGLANSLRALPADGVIFTTVPFDWAGNVVTQNDAGAVLWERIASDQPISTPEPDPTTGATPSDSPADTGGETAGGEGTDPTTDESTEPWDVTTGEDEAVCG